MKKKDTLIDLLDAEHNRVGALLMMQVSIQEYDFMYAMDAQLEYLYWNDEFQRLYRKFDAQYWDLRFQARGALK